MVDLRLAPTVSVYAQITTYIHAIQLPQGISGTPSGLTREAHNIHRLGECALPAQSARIQGM